MTMWTMIASLYDVMLRNGEDLVNLSGWSTLTSTTAFPWADGAVIPKWQSDDRLLQQIRAYNTKYQGLNKETARQRFSRPTKDNDKAGRDAVNGWLREGVKEWRVRSRILAVLAEEGLSPYDVMRQDGTRAVSAPSSLGLTHAF